MPEAESLSGPDHLATVADIVEIPLSRTGKTAKFFSFTGLPDAKEHLLILIGEPDLAAPLVRIHSECLTGDLFGSLRCDCGQQLSHAFEMLSEQQGILLYLRQEGRGIGLYNKLAAYRLQDKGFDTFQANRELGLGADLRNYAAAAAMLHSIGVSAVRLITNNPDKIAQHESYGVKVCERIPTVVGRNVHNHRYLSAKAEITKHFIPTN